MAMNLFGLGFIFGAKDKASPTIRKTGEQLEFANQAFTNLETTARTSKFNAIINSWQSIQLNNLIDQMDSIASKVASPELQSGLEGTFATYQKGFSQMTATTNMSAVEVKKWGKIVGSVAYGLDMDMGSATKTFEEFRKMNIDVTKVVSTGKKSSKAAFAELLKTMEVLGLEASDLSKIYGGLTKGFGLTTAQVRGLGDWMAHAGKTSGDATGVMKAWPGIIEAINEEGADFIKTLKPEQILSMAQGITKFGIALNKGVGTPMVEAQQQATKMFVTMAKMQKDLENMAIGMGDDMGQFGKMLVESGGDVQGMFAAIKKDPLEFMKFFKKVSAEAGKDGSAMQAMAARLNKVFMEVFGADATHLLRGNEEQLARVTQALSKIPPMGEKTAGAMAKMGKAYRTTLTHADRMERIQQAFEHRMLGIVKRGGAMNKFLRKQRDNYKRMGDTINDLSKGDGPIAGLTNVLLRVKHLGLAGLSDKFGPVLDTVGTMAMQGAPVVTMLGSMGLNFRHLGKVAGAPLAPFKLLNKATGGLGGKLLSVFGPLGIAVTALGYFSKSGGDAFKGFAKKFGEDLPNEIAKIATKWGPKWLQDIFAPFVSMEKGKVVAKGVKWTAIGEAFLTGFGKAFDWLSENFDAGKDLLARMINRVAEGIAKIDWATVFNKAIDGILSIGRAIFDGIGSLLGAIFGGGDAQGAMEANALGMGAPMGKGLKGAVTNAFNAMGKAIRTGLKTAWDRFTNFWNDESVPFTAKLEKIGKTLGGVLIGGMVLSGGLRKKVLGSFGNLFGAMKKRRDACQEGARMGECMATNFQGGMGKKKKGILAAMGGMFARGKQQVSEEATVMGNDYAANFMGGAEDTAKKPKAKGFFSGVFSGVGKGVAGARKKTKGLSAGISGIFSGVGKGAKAASKKTKGFFSGMFSGVGKGVSGASKTLIGGMKGMGKKVTTLGPSMGKALLGGFGIGILTSAVVGLPKLIGRISETVMSDSLSASDKVMGVSEGVFNWITGTLGLSAETSSAIWSAMVDTMVEGIGWVHDKVSWLVNKFVGGWDWVTTKYSQMIALLIGGAKWLAFKIAEKVWWLVGKVSVFFMSMSKSVKDIFGGIVSKINEYILVFADKLGKWAPDAMKNALGEVNKQANVFRQSQPKLYNQMKQQLIKEGKDPAPWRVAVLVRKKLEDQARKSELDNVKQFYDEKGKVLSDKASKSWTKTNAIVEGLEGDRQKRQLKRDRELAKKSVRDSLKGATMLESASERIAKGISSPKGVKVKVKPEKGEMSARLADSKVTLAESKNDPRLQLMQQNNVAVQALATQMAELKAQIAKGQHVKIELMGDMNKIFKAVGKQAGRRFAQNPV